MRLITHFAINYLNKLYDPLINSKFLHSLLAFLIEDLIALPFLNQQVQGADSGFWKNIYLQLSQSKYGINCTVSWHKPKLEIMYYISDLFLKNPFLILDNITSELKASEVPSFSPIFRRWSLSVPHENRKPSALLLIFCYPFLLR